MQPKNAAIRKRSQIAAANRMMFIWVAGASVVFGFALVAAIFLTQMLMFNEKVLHEKRLTVSTLQSNIDSVDDLKKKVLALDVNQALIDSKANESDQTLQVVLDALPSDANSLALGASLQNKLLAGISGLSLVTLQVDPVVGVESLTDQDTVVDVSADDTSTSGEITFNFSVSGDETALKQALVNLEKSIRTIDIISLKIESQEQTRVMTVQGRAFYEPARVVELKDKTITVKQ